jgi:DNA-binding XRE family transcriptional regulator
MLILEQRKIIDEYVLEKFFDKDKLCKYLETHDVVGNEVFGYCDKNNGSRNEHSYARFLDDEYGFNPVPVDTFVKRIPFYFYIAPDDIKLYGSLNDILYASFTTDRTDPDKLEQIYCDLEYLFYDVKIPLKTIFSYMIDQYGVVTAPFQQYVQYIRLCRHLGWNDYTPKSFISAFNYAREAAGLNPIIYEVEAQYIGDFFYRNGKYITFDGIFPRDKNGNPVMKWIGVRVENSGEITCSGEKCKSGVLKIELRPNTKIELLNVYNDVDEEEDCWYQIYAGPQTMQFNHEVLKENRNRLRYTQKQVADAVGATLRTYQKWESGVTTPDGHYLLRLMNWLDITDVQYMIKYNELTKIDQK